MDLVPSLMCRPSCACTCQLTTFLIVTDTYVHHENISLIQSLTLMHLAISMGKIIIHTDYTHTFLNLYNPRSRKSKKSVVIQWCILIPNNVLLQPLHQALKSAPFMQMWSHHICVTPAPVGGYCSLPGECICLPGFTGINCTEGFNILILWYNNIIVQAT